MNMQKYIIRYGCNDFIFEGSLLELTNIIRSLEKLTPVIYTSLSETYEETGLKKRLRIYSAKKEEADNITYAIDK